MFSKINQALFNYIGLPFLSPDSPLDQATVSIDDNDDPSQMQHSTPQVIPPSSPIPSQPATFYAIPLYCPEPMLLDLFDLRCHEAILETDPVQIGVRISHLNDLRSKLPDMVTLHPCINARLILADYVENLVVKELGQVREGPLDAFKVCVNIYKHQKEKWNKMRQAVVQAKTDFASHDLLQGGFRKVGRLLHYQHILAFFRYELHKDNETSVDTAIKNLEDGWHGGDFLLNEDEEVRVPSRIQSILEPVKRRRADIGECLQRCQYLLMRDESNEFSHAHLQHKVRMVGLRRWFLCVQTDSPPSNTDARSDHTLVHGYLGLPEIISIVRGIGYAGIG